MEVNAILTGYKQRLYNILFLLQETPDNVSILWELFTQSIQSSKSIWIDKSILLAMLLPKQRYDTV